MPSSGLDPSTFESMVTTLEEAIAKGNVELAGSMAKNLAENKARLCIHLITVGQANQTFRLDVKMESATDGLPTVPVPIQVNSKMTIFALKVKVAILYGVPLSCQKWILGRKIAKDHESLKKLNITQPTQVILYILQPKSVSDINRGDISSEEEMLQKFHDSMINRGENPDLAITLGELEKFLQGNMRNNGNPVALENRQNWPPPRGPPRNAWPNNAEVEWHPPRGGPPRSAWNDTVEVDGRIEVEQIASGEDNVDGEIDGERSYFDSFLARNVNGQQMRSATFPLARNRPAHRHVPLPPPPRHQVHPPQKKTAKDVGWPCTLCTFVNPPTIPACRSCLDPRPENYKIPDPNSYTMDPDEKRHYDELLESELLLKKMEDDEKTEEILQVERNRLQMMEVASQNLVANTDAFECPICMTDINPHEGVKLRSCLHDLCRECLENHINLSPDAEIKCPYTDGEHNCDEIIPDIEIRQIITKEEYDRYLNRGLTSAEAAAPDSFHCKTPDCVGLCFYDDAVNFFDCEVCGHQNCLTCKAIHEDLNCKQYQEDLKIKAGNDDAAKKTHQALLDMVKNGEAMNCPKCGIIIQKKSGCDWLKCSICKVEICWVTKGARWGPKGPGDTSGGCKCRANGKCHPQCGNCH